jgi:hypothetical protein
VLCSDLQHTHARRYSRGMENIQSPSAGQRANAHVASTRSRMQGETVPVASHVARSMRNTFLAFTTLTAATPLLPAAVRPMRLPAAGMIYADLQQQPSGMGFAPRPSRRQERMGLMISLFPFIPAYALQTHMSEVSCADPHSAFSRIAAHTEAAWKGFWRAKSGNIARAAECYPINFTLARGFWQMVAAAVGALMATQYHRNRGAELVTRLSSERPPTLSQRLARKPELYLQAGLLFSLPAALDSAIGRRMLQSLRVPRFASNVISTCALVGAAAKTAIVVRGENG